MFDLVAEYGFFYSGLCSICKNQYKVFKHNDKAGVEIKIHLNNRYFKLYQPNHKGIVRQTAFGNMDQLKAIIATV